MNARQHDEKTVVADEGVRRGRLTKARQFLKVANEAVVLADEATEIADAAVTLYVHAGIAASDAICARELGMHAQGDSHRGAVKLLKRVDVEASNHLKVLLDMKSRAGYSPLPISAARLTRAQRAARFLVEAASR